MDILVAQIEELRPDVIYLQDISMGTNALLSRLKPLCELIVGQIASPLPARAALDQLDVIISSFPHFVDRFRRDGILSLYQPLAFPSEALAKALGDDVMSTTDTSHRDIPVSFIGGISALHSDSNDLLCRLASETDIGFWGYGGASLPPESPIAKRHHGPLWGLDMFRHYGRSRITINRHAAVAKNNANNMRLFEATGCGALLITDHKDNLPDLFDVGSEIVSYRDVDECVDMVHKFCDNPAAAHPARSHLRSTYGANRRFSRLPAAGDAHAPPTRPTRRRRCRPGTS